MKTLKNITLIQYICRILSIRDDFSAFPYYVTYKIIAEFLKKLKKKSCTFRVYLGIFCLSIFRIMINII